VTFLGVDIQYLAYNLLSLPDVVTDVLNPSTGHFRNRDQSLPVVILVKRDKCHEIFNILN